MRPSRIFRMGCCVLFISAPFVSSTVLTATMLTSFMGGFLMGKMTLGTFLMLMQGLNNGQQTILSPSKNRESSPAAAASAISTATVPATASALAVSATQAEIDFRDKVLKQLGQMDPLNCLPKVFCELSAQNVQVLDDVDVGNDEEKVNEGSPENSEEDDNSDSDETHDEQEGPDEEDELNERLENRKKKQNLKLEHDALEDLLEETHEPSDYYFILKDKMKLRPKYNRYTASHPPFFPKKSSNFLKKRGSPTQNYQDESEYKTMEEVKPNKNIDDIFADDPFFDDFSRSMKFSPETVDYHRVGRQLRRIEEKTGDFRRKYRVAATVGEKSAQSCQYVFHTCPFKADQIMAMVNTIRKKNNGEYYIIQSEEKSTTTTAPVDVTNKVENLTRVEQKKENLQNLKNTLLAIESLNNITLMAQTAGLPVSYNSILADIMENDDLEMTGASAKILDEFDKEASNMTMAQTEEIDDTIPKSAERDIEITTKKSTKRRKTAGRTKTKKNKNRRSKYRILRNKSGNRRRSGISKRSLSFRMSRSSSSEESHEMPEDSPSVLKLELPGRELIPVTEEHEDTVEPGFDTHPSEPEDVGRIYFLKEEFEDDEAIASEEENLFIPEFAKIPAYKRRPPTQTRPQPSPTPPPRIPPYQYQQLGGDIKRFRLTTTTEHPPIRPSQGYPPGYNYNSESVLFGPKMRPQEPTIPPRRKLTGPIEDDEADASESDRAVEKIIATRHQIKVRPFQYRTSKESTSSENATVLT